MIVVVMGVAGSGKTTIGRLLSSELGWPFFDADDFHSPANIERMQRGIALTDEDRLPWLHAIRARMQSILNCNESAIFACSALKAGYRKILRGDDDCVKFVYLKGDYELLRERLEEREAHFMKAEMLAGQLETLEEPALAITVDISQTPDEIVKQIRAALGC